MQSTQKLFPPIDKKKSLTDLYSELRSYPQIATLKKEEQWFCWLFGCKSSELTEIENKRERAAQAYDIAFKNKYSQEDRKKFAALQFPEKIREGIKVMELFSPEVRDKARDAASKMFENLIKIMSLDIDTFLNFEVGVNEDGEKMTPEEHRKLVAQNMTIIKEYTTSSQKAREAMPEVIKTLEEGYGITDTSSGAVKDKQAFEDFIRAKRDA